ncbi:MAG: 50S ribosomal protein L3 [bacterium]|nr:50S ribosomal protein L3 [bacterium]
MITAILGTKSHMEQGFTTTGRRVVLSVVKTGENVVTQVKSPAKEGYSALQIAHGKIKLKSVTKPMLGHLKNAGKFDKIGPRFLREIRIAGDSEYKVGDVVNIADILTAGDLVKVTGTSKGKGFAGVVKRYGFAGGPKTHGQSDRHRAPGSIGQGTTPGRVLKGKKMAGRMGNELVSVRNLTVFKVGEDGTVWLSGPIPGTAKNLIIIEKIGENKKFQELYTEQQLPSEENEQIVEESSQTESVKEKIEN